MKQCLVAVGVLSIVGILEARGQALDDLGNQLLAGQGFVDVTAKPFGADPTGRTDATAALQQAVIFAREHQMVTFFPSGTYLVSDTIRCIQTRHDPVSKQVLRSRRKRDWPCVLLGSSAAGRRPRLLLAPNSPGFGNPKRPKYVVHFWARAVDEGACDDPQPNISMNQVFRGIDITIGPGNPGAVAVRHRAAQGSSVQECTIDARHGYCGLEGGAGSGGSHMALTVIGGRIGIDYRQTQPAPTLTGVTLIDQTEAAIVCESRQALCAVGLSIRTRTAGPVIVTRQPRGPHHGQLCLVDSEVVSERPGANVLIDAGAALTMHNVYVHGGSTLVRAAGKDVLPGVPGEPGGWVRVVQFALGIDPPAVPGWLSRDGYRYRAPVYLDGVRQPAARVAEVEQGSAPPADLMTRHLWTAEFPRWEAAGVANVRAAPYGAVGDGRADDAKALQRAIDENEVVFLPKGQYAVSRPLELRARTKLIGTGRSYSWIKPLHGTGGAFDDRAQVQPVVRSVDDADADCVLAFLGIEASWDSPHVYCLQWRAGGRSIVREVEFRFPFGWREKRGSTRLARHPAVLIEGNGGGKWYDFNMAARKRQGPEFRLLLIRGTRSPLAFYQCNPEYGRGKAEMEVRDGRFVTFYGVKSEYNETILAVRDSDHIRVFGYGGNASAFEGRALFRVERTPNFLLANLVDSPRKAGTGSADSSPGIVVDPRKWYMVIEETAGGKTIRTEPLDRPVLYQRGHPVGAP